MPRFRSGDARGATTNREPAQTTRPPCSGREDDGKAGLSGGMLGGSDRGSVRQASNCSGVVSVLEAGPRPVFPANRQNKEVDIGTPDSTCEIQTSHMLPFPCPVSLSRCVGRLSTFRGKKGFFFCRLLFLSAFLSGALRPEKSTFSWRGVHKSSGGGTILGDNRLPIHLLHRHPWILRRLHHDLQKTDVRHVGLFFVRQHPGGRGSGCCQAWRCSVRDTDVSLPGACTGRRPAAAADKEVLVRYRPAGETGVAGRSAHALQPHSRYRRGPDRLPRQHRPSDAGHHATKSN